MKLLHFVSTFLRTTKTKNTTNRPVRSARRSKAVPDIEASLLSEIDNTNDPVIVIDNTSNIVLWNHASEIMFGYSADEVIGKALSKHDLSHRWDVEQNGAEIRVTCVLTHVRGHRESVPMVATADASGSKNPIQAIGSTITYLQRYTLLAATGMAVKDQDDDGQVGDIERVSEEQIANLEALIEEVDADRAKFLRWAKAEKLGDVQAAFYPTAVKMLEAKRKKESAA